ncbi:MAG TPA: DUF1722 domain-containing protein [Spirochaetes bacterium]|nr:DUF1722 domain-containing protein [Spirochaetota bacterium]
MDKIRLGISTCLLGKNVRYDGGHKLDRWLRDTLGAYIDYVPVCPEAEAGFGIPREAFRLVGDPSAPRLMTVKTKVDHTERMETWARHRVKELEKENLCGYVFKSDSPSSGMERVKVYDANNVPRKAGAGIFARIFMEHFSLLPVEEEGRLHDPLLRETFIERIFTFHRWKQAMAKGGKISSLVDFHTRNKLLILCHSPKHHKEMGRLTAAAKGRPFGEVEEEYTRLLMEALAVKATPARHVNTLQHIMGYFKKQLTPDEKEELLENIGRYRAGLVPLVVPVTLLNHYVRKYDEPYLKLQTYLNPHPVELKLRNHA